jgi:hypothetical protein
MSEPFVESFRARWADMLRGVWLGTARTDDFERW